MPENKRCHQPEAHAMFAVCRTMRNRYSLSTGVERIGHDRSILRLIVLHESFSDVPRMALIGDGRPPDAPGHGRAGLA
jgi:hypothetical protein